MKKRAIILVLDSLGVGSAADAAQFGDEGANTFGHIAQAAALGHADIGRQGPLKLPHLSRLGLPHACELSCGVFPAGFARLTPEAAYGFACEVSTGKDTPSGHWEMAGVPVLFDWGYFHEPQNSFPAALLEAIVQQANLPGFLGNCHASGTEIIDRLGIEHIASGRPIFYTSADSVFQIACHEESFGLERLYALCRLVRDILAPYNIGRVIARPFIGTKPGEFVRTGNRADLTLAPPEPTVLERLTDAGGKVFAVGKIADIYAHQGISYTFKASGLDALWDSTLEAVDRAPEHSLIMSNFVDFDTLYGHRRDVAGYAAALEAFDRRLPDLLLRLKASDMLFLTADHGCDPTWPGSDHTREHIPVLCYGQRVQAGSIGRRASFADIGQTVARHLGLTPLKTGLAFA